MTVLHIETK